jgi:hypothetical protein
MTISTQGHVIAVLWQHLRRKPLFGRTGECLCALAISHHRNYRNFHYLVGGHSHLESTVQFSIISHRLRTEGAQVECHISCISTL